MCDGRPRSALLVGPGQRGDRLRVLGDDRANVHATSESRASARPDERAQLDVRPRPRLFAEPVDPDRAEAELACRRDVVEETRADVHVPSRIGPRARVELLPVLVAGLVRADLGRDDRELEGDTDGLHRRVDELAVGVREDRELPAARTRFLERGAHLGERLPRGQRAAERVLLVGCGHVAEPGERDREHVSVAPRRLLALHLRLDLVVAMQQRRGAIGPEEPLELAPDAAVPVDERAVAVECRPAVHTWRIMADRATHYRWDDIPREELNPLLGRASSSPGGDDDRAGLSEEGLHRSDACARERATDLHPRGLPPLHARRGREQETVDVRAGEVLTIPRNLPHQAEALEDTLDVDVFNPPRQDWLDGSDAYLRRPV